MSYREGRGGLALRYIIRNGEKILQQCYEYVEYDNNAKPIDGGIEWRDIETVGERLCK